jgi:hypothetical protein
MKASKGRLFFTITSQNIFLVVSNSHNLHSTCCLHCIEAGYISCLNATSTSGQTLAPNHGTSIPRPTAVLSLESAGFNELNELFEFEISDSFVQTADLSRVGWMEWERRLQDCGRSAVALAHSNGTGPPTCMRHNPNRLTAINGNTLDGKFSFFVRLDYSVCTIRNSVVHHYGRCFCGRGYTLFCDCVA